MKLINVKSTLLSKLNKENIPSKNNTNKEKQKEVQCL